MMPGADLRDLTIFTFRRIAKSWLPKLEINEQNSFIIEYSH